MTKLQNNICSPTPLTSRSRRISSADSRPEAGTTKKKIDKRNGFLVGKEAAELLGAEIQHNTEFVGIIGKNHQIIRRKIVPTRAETRPNKKRYVRNKRFLLPRIILKH
jgi:hypothetical protein